MNVFQIFADLLLSAADFSGGGLFEFVASEFPSDLTPNDDRKPQAAMNAMDASFSAIKPTMILDPAYLVNTSTNNPGSLLVNDRIDDGNTYLALLSLALMGTLENQYGNPLPNFHKANNLPWEDATSVSGNGCAFVSALFHFKDALSFLQTSSPPALSTTYSTIATMLNNGLDASCTLGCLDCAMVCTSCPFSLRNRNSCTGVATDENSCAAAGVIKYMVNVLWAGPP